MNSVIMDDVELGDESIVGALTFIKEGEIIPSEYWCVAIPEKLISSNRGDDSLENKGHRTLPGA
jgi:carbonic anhydrase/acetyltransferase-like protein (isoleucine patch superfamily)